MQLGLAPPRADEPIGSSAANREPRGTTLPSVLIADDQPDVRIALELLLKSDGFRTTAVDSPAGALAAVERDHFDLALLDLNYARDTTSGEEGLDLLRRLRALDTAVPILVMTAWGTIDLAVEAMRRGARGFVLKPWRNPELLRTVREQLAVVAASPQTGGERDLAVARRVQIGFLPRTGPVMTSLEYEGWCAQAGPVGGDGYDFLDLGGGRLGVVLADASGKGVPGALLMASLQGILRSGTAHGAHDPLALLAETNRIFYDSTAPEHYATLFFATFEDESGLLRYVNCGHNPPLVLRADGRAERLSPTVRADVTNPLAQRCIAVMRNQQRLACDLVEELGLVRRVHRTDRDAVHALGQQIVKNLPLLRRLTAGGNAKIEAHVAQFLHGVIRARTRDGPEGRGVVHHEGELEFLASCALLLAATSDGERRAKRT
jgi:CheY-like chemotaxis protein